MDIEKYEEAIALKRSINSIENHLAEYKEFEEALNTESAKITIKLFNRKELELLPCYNENNALTDFKNDMLSRHEAHVKEMIEELSSLLSSLNKDFDDL